MDYRDMSLPALRDQEVQKKSHKERFIEVKKFLLGSGIEINPGSGTTWDDYSDTDLYTDDDLFGHLRSACIEVLSPTKPSLVRLQTFAELLFEIKNRGLVAE